jgi:hypothetical protein
MNARSNHNESGSVLVAVLFVAFLMAGMAGAMFLRSTTSSRGAARNAAESRLLMAAETGLNINAVRMATDPVYCVRDTARFSVAAGAGEYVGATEAVASGTGPRNNFTLRVQYLRNGVPVLFANRANPTENWTTLRVVSTATAGGLTRQVAGWYAYRPGPGFQSAVISSATSNGAAAGGGKGQAQRGDVVFDYGNRQQQILFGGVSANGQVWLDGPMVPLSSATAPGNLAAYSGQFTTMLGSTPNPVPNFCNPGAPEQLFSFPRFHAAATAGAGRVFNSLASFVTAQRAANLLGQPLEGITVLNLNPAIEGGSPKIDTGDLPQGINIRGTLVFRFAPGTAPDYKVFITTALNINAANLAGWNPGLQSTYTTGYPPAFANPALAPWNVNISPTYENFTAQSDLPALMFETGIVDIHGPANVCGAIYGPSFIEIENKTGGLQYFNGCIIGGAGIYFEGNSTGMQAIKFDPAAVDMLETYGNNGKTLQRTGFTILR